MIASEVDAEAGVWLRTQNHYVGAGRVVESIKPDGSVVVGQ
ncbi:MAG: hypothetical protein Q8Q09_10350 [Deltaproteobacteria bacterium]|nr:hypothetical protein [Deltaproteobacteria bacterium]